MFPLGPSGTNTSFPLINSIKNDVNSLESSLPPNFNCKELTCATKASTPSISRVISLGKKKKKEKLDYQYNNKEI